MHPIKTVLALWIACLAFIMHRGTALSDEINVGDTRDEVIQALGEPKGSSAFAGIEILYYPRGQVEIESGKVVSHSLITPGELEARTKKRLKEEEARRQREELRRASQVAEEEKSQALPKDANTRSVTRKRDPAKNLYKVGALKTPLKKPAALSEAWSSGSLSGSLLPKPDWTKSSSENIAYVFTRQVVEGEETDLYVKRPRGVSDGKVFCKVRRHDQEKTISLYTKSSGGEPKYLLEFKGNGEVPVYRLRAGSKSPDWSYLVRRDGNETDGRLHVYDTKFGADNQWPSLIIETDRKTGRAGIFSVKGGLHQSRTRQDYPVRIYDPSRNQNGAGGSANNAFSAEVVAIFSAVHQLRPR